MLVAVVLPWCAGAQTVKISAFPTDTIRTNGDYIAGVRDVAGSWANFKYRLPKGGVLQRDNAGVLRATPFATLLEARRGPGWHDSLYSIGSNDVGITWFYDTVAQVMKIKGIISVNDPTALATPPDRTALTLVRFAGLSYYGVWKGRAGESIFNVDSEPLELYGSAGYFSDVDVVMEWNPILGYSYLYMYLPRPVDAVSAYFVCFNIVIAN